MITQGRFNAVAQLVKSAIDDLEDAYPGDDVTALHQTLATAQEQAQAVSARIWGGDGAIPLDGDPKPPK